MKISTMSTDISAKLHFGFLAFLCLELHVSVSIASSQNITNNTSEALPTLSSLASLKKDGFSFWSDKFRAKLRAGLPAKISIQVLQQQKNKIRPPTASLYQNQVMDTKMKLDMAESQKAPDDATSGLLTKHPADKPKKLIFCYYGSSANSRPGLGKFWPEHIDPFLCTHLVFAFVGITEDGTGLRPNNWNDLGENGLYARTMKLKEKNPDLKILLAVGGWKIGSKPFIPVMQSEETWKIWASNVVAYLRKHNFDGFDMDWEFPAWRGSAPEDRHKFTLLMKELYEAFGEETISSGKEKLILTFAAASSAFYAEKSYEQSELHKYFDYMLLMTYNFHGSGWEKQTGHHSPLLPHPLDPEGEQRELFILWAIKYWVNFGVPKEKIIVGLATYGLGWKLTDVTQTGVKAPANGGTTKGKYTEEAGILSHFEICENVIEHGWKVQWIEEQKVPYAYGEGEWVGFDSPDSFYLKAATIIKEGLGGAFVWSIEMDDFNGHCGGPKYPLLRTIYEVFTQSSTASNLDSHHSLKSHHHSSSAAANSGPPESHSSEHKDEESVKSASASADHSADDHQTESDSGKDVYYPSYYTYDDDDDDDYSNSEQEIVDCSGVGLGIHADPTSCQHFILCIPLSHYEHGTVRMSCPAGTLFDDQIKVCNHQHNVKCRH